jgi:hypothetical protein
MVHAPAMQFNMTLQEKNVIKIVANFSKLYFYTKKYGSNFKVRR